ncbi:MAG: EamA family transporter [Campylobacteraceae bacterium 4484_166]|nr:MAG: EamA family transporter [Campylobacteraceae bacterium 4484_166]
MTNTTKQAVYYMLFSSFLFAFTGGFAKLLTQHISSVEVVFFRNIVGVIIISYAIYKTPLIQTGGKPLLLFLRGFVGFVALLMYFYNIANIPLAEAQTFNKISPIFTALFSYLLLNEKLSKQSIMGIIVGFVGVLFITGFDITTLDKTDWLGILSGLFAGLAYTSIRELRKYYDNRIIVLSFMTVGTIGPIVLMIMATFVDSVAFDWVVADFTMPNGIAWLYIVGLGAFATASQWFMTKAYSLALGGMVGTISYTNIVFSIMLGYMLGDKFPTSFVIIGIAFIILSGVLVAFEKTPK